MFIGDDDPLAPRWSFESGMWDMHGHAWRHKHSLTLRAWGEKLLIERDILPYEDARSEYRQNGTSHRGLEVEAESASPQTWARLLLSSRIMPRPGQVASDARFAEPSCFDRT